MSYSLTPADEEAAYQEFLARCESHHNDGVQVKPLTEHPEEITTH